MNIVENIKSYLTKLNNNESVETPDGFCPNCWGRQEYGGKFYEAYKAESTNLKNNNSNKGWIQDYADKNLSEIILQKIDGKANCSVCYKKQLG